jgi:hypothetical protein
MPKRKRLGRPKVMQDGVQITFWLDAHAVQSLTALASREGMTRSALVRRLCMVHIVTNSG